MKTRLQSLLYHGKDMIVSDSDDKKDEKIISHGFIIHSHSRQNEH